MKKYLLCLLFCGFSLPILAQKNEIAADILWIPKKDYSNLFGTIAYYHQIAKKWDMGLRIGNLYTQLNDKVESHNVKYIYYQLYVPQISVIYRRYLINKPHFSWSVEGGLSMGRRIPKYYDPPYFPDVIYRYIDHFEEKPNNIYGLATATLLEGKIGKHLNLGINLATYFYTTRGGIIANYIDPYICPTLRTSYHW